MVTSVWFTSSASGTPGIPPGLVVDGPALTQAKRTTSRKSSCVSLSAGRLQYTEPVGLLGRCHLFSFRTTGFPRTQFHSLPLYYVCLDKMLVLPPRFTASPTRRQKKATQQTLQPVVWPFGWSPFEVITQTLPMFSIIPM